MIIIKNDFQTIMTSLSHEQIESLFADRHTCAWVAASDDSTQKTHWNAEPSVVRKMAMYCAQHGHLFVKVKTSAYDFDN